MGYLWGNFKPSRHTIDIFTKENCPKEALEAFDEFNINKDQGSNAMHYDLWFFYQPIAYLQFFEGLYQKVVDWENGPKKTNFAQVG